MHAFFQVSHLGCLGIPGLTNLFQAILNVVSGQLNVKKLSAKKIYFYTIEILEIAYLQT